MSRVSLAIALATTFVVATPALAADLYGRAPAYNDAGNTNYGTAPTTNWTGAYLGGQAGYGWGDDHNDGGQIGIYGGYNNQFGQNVVGGVEADVNLSNQSMHKNTVRGNRFKGKSDWNGTVRARVGVPIDRVMPYATAGIAFADDTAKGLGASDSQTKVGWVLGAGVEAQVVDRVTAKAEVLHMGFGSTDHTLANDRGNNTVNTTVLRGGVAYHF